MQTGHSRRRGAMVHWSQIWFKLATYWGLQKHQYQQLYCLIMTLLQLELFTFHNWECKAIPWNLENIKLNKAFILAINSVLFYVSEKKRLS